MPRLAHFTAAVSTLRERLPAQRQRKALCPLAILQRAIHGLLELLARRPGASDRHAALAAGGDARRARRAAQALCRRAVPGAARRSTRGRRRSPTRRPRAGRARWWRPSTRCGRRSSPPSRRSSPTRRCRRRTTRSRRGLLRLLLHQAAHGADAPPPDDADADAPLESPIAAGAPLWAGRAASEGLLRLGAALWAAHSAGSPAAAAEGAFASEALRRLLALLSIALCRTVGVEAPATFGAKLREWDATRAHFGLPRPALCALLDGPSKALLLYADGCAARGDGRVRVDVTRGAALWDALPQWEGTAFAHADADAVSMAIGGGGGGGAVDEIGDLEDELRALENELAGDEAPAAAAAAPAAADVATATARGAKLFPRFHGPNGFEAGEGHGPRKELFALVGQQLLNGAAASDSGVGGARRAILPYDASARQHWFDARREGGARGLPHDEARLLRFCGWMIAQAILNRVAPTHGLLPPYESPPL